MYMVKSVEHIVVVIFALGSLHLCAGGWGNWGPWTSCTKTCGMGIQTRLRQCVAEPNEECRYTNETQEVVCSIKEYCAPIDGRFGEWSGWTNCTRRCGGGTHWRTRACDNPRPMYGGKMCEGDVEEMEQCSTQPCPPLYTKNDSVLCESGYVVCGSGRDCIVAHHRCDGYYDCSDGTDESACVEGEPVVFIKLNLTSSSSFPISSHFPTTISVLSLVYNYFPH